ncbi:MAG: glycoside hydrolase family 3 protein [Spirochaetales bacterium]|nr:glycoside hydrolase family 3 protein [Spirochaetales bacterium]
MTGASGQARVDFWSVEGEPGEAARVLAAALSPEELLGQLFMMTYPGTEPSPLLFEWIRTRALGGIKVFGWNAEDTGLLARVVARVQEAAAASPHGIPPLVATDQEGGWIRHVKGGTSETPGAMAIGASGRPVDAYRAGLYIGRELSALGVTMNFAPTVDLATRPRSPIIGSRAFSDDPATVGALATAFYRGMDAAGVACTAKHFPGHGDTELDSHGILPVIDIDPATLWDRELVPYRMLAAEGIPAVMSGHLAYPRVSGDSTPASLSPALLEGYLRERIGFDGVVVTDDLFMSGAAISGGFAEACVRALEAGNDIIMISRTLGLDDRAWTRLLDKYREEPDFAARVRRSAERVLELKLRYLRPRGKSGVGPAPESERALRSDESKAFFLDLAARSATALPGWKGPLFPSEAGRVLLVGQYGDFFAEGSLAYPAAAWFRYSYSPADAPVAAELESLLSLAGRFDSIVLSVSNRAGEAYLEALADQGRKVWVVSSLSPAFSLGERRRAGGIAVYGYSRESFAAAFAALSGGIEPSGRLPFTP